MMQIRYGLPNEVKDVNFKSKIRSKKNESINFTYKQRDKLLNSFGFSDKIKIEYPEKKKSSNLKFLNIPNFRTKNDSSIISTSSVDTSRSIKEQIDRLTRQSRDFSIIHTFTNEKSRAQNEIHESNVYGVLSSLNSSISKK